MPKIVEIPPPLRGLNTVEPNLDLNSGYARELTNFSIINGRIIMRPAVVSEAYNASGDDLSWIDYSGGTYYCIKTTTGNIRTVTTDAGGTSIGGACAFEPTELDHLSLDYVIGLREPRLRAYPFTAWTCTTIAITATAISSACSHKGRMYISDGTTIEYSGIGQITGSFSVSGGTFPVSSFMDGQTIYRMFSANLAGDGQQNLFVVFGDQGKVLVYQGDFPGSSSWALIGNYDMPIPNSRRSILAVDGDVFVATREYAYWLRDLIVGGRALAYSNSPSKPIQNLWAGLGWINSGPEAPHVYELKTVSAIVGLDTYDVGLDAIVVQCSEKTTNSTLTGIANYTNEAACLVYFKKYGAWALWLGAPFFAPVRFLNGSYVGINYGQAVQKLASGYQDDEHGGGTGDAVVSTWKTPYISPYAGRNQRSVGIRPFYKSLNITAPQVDAGYFHKIQAIFDFSDANTAFSFYTQETVTYVPPGNASGFSSLNPTINTYNNYNPYIGVGGVGGAVSYQFTLMAHPNAATVAAYTGTKQIYAATAYIEDGGDMII